MKSEVRHEEGRSADYAGLNADADDRDDKEIDEDRCGRGGDDKHDEDDSDGCDGNEGKDDDQYDMDDAHEGKSRFRNGRKRRGRHDRDNEGARDDSDDRNCDDDIDGGERRRQRKERSGGCEYDEDWEDDIDVDGYIEDTLWFFSRKMARNNWQNMIRRRRNRYAYDDGVDCGDCSSNLV